MAPLSQLLLLCCLTLLAAVDSARTQESSPCGLSFRACPGSTAPDGEHASCSLKVELLHTCSVVQQEIQARIANKKDRKSHPGTYELITAAPDKCTKGSRTTGEGAHPGPFTDLFGFNFIDNDSDGCVLHACSESQVKSLCDYSTNFCNVFNLICGSADGCAFVHTDLKHSHLKTAKDCYHTDKCAKKSSLPSGEEADPKLCTR